MFCSNTLPTTERTNVSHSEIFKYQNAGLVFIMIIVKYILELDFILNNWTK